jgi:undecaprenyl-diphosphatase
MEVLKVLEAHRTPLLDEFFNLITYFGDETIILVVAFVVLWCVNKRMGYFIIYSLLMGVTVNQFLKGFFQVPRPWVRDPAFKIVESARASATGYSFPSGHTQNSTVLFGSIARSVKSRLWSILMILLIFLVGFSRMYLGVHTPEDVVTSWIIGTALVFLLYPLLRKAEENKTVAVLLNTFFVLAAVLLVIYSEVTPPGVGDAAQFSAEGKTNAYTALGVIAAFPLVWYLDRYKIRYDVQAVWWAQILKCIVGLGLVMAVRVGLKPLLVSLTGGHGIGTSIRYFCIALFGGTVWPMTFKFWSRLGR